MFVKISVDVDGFTCEVDDESDGLEKVYDVPRIYLFEIWGSVESLIHYILVDFQFRGIFGRTKCFSSLRFP